MRDRYPPSPKHPDDDYWHPVPPDSYSRELDSRVQAQEMPYGYSMDPPPADSGDYDTRSRNSNKQYPMRKGRAI